MGCLGFWWFGAELDWGGEDRLARYWIENFCMQSVHGEGGSIENYDTLILFGQLRRNCGFRNLTMF